MLGVKARRTFSETASSTFERKGALSWDFDELPEQVEVDRGKGKLIGYPAIVDEGKSVGLTLLAVAPAGISCKARQTRC